MSFQLNRGEVLGIVGESGSGKSVTSLAMMGLLAGSARVSGSVRLHGTELLGASDKALSRVRGQSIAMIFQDPMTSLNPVYSIGYQVAEAIIAEPLRIHGLYGPSGRADVRELLRLVGLAPEHGNRFPHEFSGGQRQRIGIARALALRPKVLVLDEPVSALDVSIQAGVLNLLADLQAQLRLSYLFVSHDLSVVRHIADRVAGSGPAARCSPLTSPTPNATAAPNRFPRSPPTTIAPPATTPNSRPLPH